MHRTSVDSRVRDEIIDRTILKETARKIDFATRIPEADWTTFLEAMRGRNITSMIQVSDVAKDLILNAKFSSVQAALREAVRAADDWSASGLAAQNMILTKAYNDGVDCANTNDLKATIYRLGMSGKLVLSPLGQQRRQQANQETKDEQERLDLIAKITRGHAAFPLPQSLQKKYLGIDYGKSRNFESKWLEGQPLAVVREVAAVVKAYRAARDGKESTIDPSTIDDPSTISATYTPTRQQVELQQQAQETPTAADLISPVTGVRYSRKELMKMVGSDLEGFRKLVKQNRPLVDEILAGRA